MINKLNLYKPLKPNRNIGRNQSYIFDTLGIKCRGNFKPFIFFYDEQADCYYYLIYRKANYPIPRDDNEIKELLTIKGYSEKEIDKLLINPITYDSLRKSPLSRNMRKIELDNQLIDLEVIIKPSGDSYYLDVDSYVDCSQIFKCDRTLLESLVENDEVFNDIEYISEGQKWIILDKIKELMFYQPPLISIVEILKDKYDETYGSSIYLHETIFKRDCEDYDGETIGFIEDFGSFKNGSTYQKRRYNEGINFCKVFLNKYFPEELQRFNKLNSSENKY